MLVKIKKLESSIATWIFSSHIDDYILFSCLLRDNNLRIFLCFKKIEYKSKTYYKILYYNKIIYINASEVEEEII